jgi:glycosyltransferase involved in cell wall biosynthesis
MQDEEAVIESGLRDCAPHVDEIILIDGGSVDRTMEIAAQVPKVKIYEHPFPFDFSLQKNRCLEYANCEYILFKDADETFEKDVFDNLQRLTDKEPYTFYDAFSFARKTYVDGVLNNMCDPDHQIRLWRQGKGIHYAGTLHETVVGFGNLLNCTSLFIIHDKTGAMQFKDNLLYWDMGQQPDVGWVKKGGEWVQEEIPPPATGEQGIRPPPGAVWNEADRRWEPGPYESENT